MTQVEAVITAETIADKLKRDLSISDLVKLKTWLCELLDHIENLELERLLEVAS